VEPHSNVGQPSAVTAYQLGVKNPQGLVVMAMSDASLAGLGQLWM